MQQDEEAAQQVEEQEEVRARGAAGGGRLRGPLERLAVESSLFEGRRCCKAAPRRPRRPHHGHAPFESSALYDPAPLAVGPGPDRGAGASGHQQDGGFRAPGRMGGAWWLGGCPGRGHGARPDASALPRQLPPTPPRRFPTPQDITKLKEGGLHTVESVLHTPMKVRAPGPGCAARGAGGTTAGQRRRRWVAAGVRRPSLAA
jgi:hypothetical protein